MKYVVVTGGVVSGLGKGITSSSLGVLLKASGLAVTCIKIDPYLNIDAGTMSPYEHGEVFVLDDGGEADLDLGNYERFLDISLSRDHNITTGKIYQHVLSKERQGKYLGKTVQVVPHITDAVMEWIITVAQQPVDDSKTIPDVCLIELGGTVGDIESMIYLEALRQLRYKVGKHNFCLVHVSLVPVVSAVGEPKTKPTQHGVRELMRSFLEPDILVCRSSKPLARDIINKLALSCMVTSDNVVGVHDVSNIYKVPLLLLEQRVPSLIMRALCINKSPVDALPKWANLALKAESAPKEVTIGFVGKYTGLSDSYLSVTHALTHAAIASDCKLIIRWIESQHLEEDTKTSAPEQYEAAWATLKGVNGILVPGGFGDRGVNGKIVAANYARTNKIPFLGICLGLQVAVIEFARSVCKWSDAHSSEFASESPHPVVIFMPEGSTEIKGGTMRLGSRVCNVREGTLAWQLYEGSATVNERHRHRYEVNPKYIQDLEKAGLVFSGIDENKERMEIVELPESSHPFFLGLQAHPEFKSRPLKPSPPFHGLILASAGKFVRRDVPRRRSTVASYAASTVVTSSLAAGGALNQPSPSPSPDHSPTHSRRASGVVAPNASGVAGSTAPTGPSGAVSGAVSGAASVAASAFLSTPHAGLFGSPTTPVADNHEHKSFAATTPASAPAATTPAAAPTSSVTQ